jgi:hypothetical protein
MLNEQYYLYMSNTLYPVMQHNFLEEWIPQLGFDSEYRYGVSSSLLPSPDRFWAHLVSSTGHCGLFSCSTKLITYLNLVPRLRMNAVLKIPVLWDDAV